MTTDRDDSSFPNGESILANVARLFAAEGDLLAVEVLSKSSAQFHWYTYDNWNDGFDIYKLKLIVNFSLYKKVYNDRHSLEQKILEKFHSISQGHTDDCLESVSIILHNKENDDWREKASQWIESKRVTELHTITSIGNKELPQGTNIALKMGDIPETVTVELGLPGQHNPTTLQNLPIANGTLVLPIPLVFLCHANEDKNFVESVSNRLWQDGYFTWYDKKDLLPGDNWKFRIEETIEQSDRIIVFLSKTSINKTGYVQREIKFALQQHQLRPNGQRYIIPALVEECQIPREFKDIQWLQMWGENWRPLN